MPKPWRNPRSRFWWFRKKVPLSLRALLGVTEIRCSLNTTDAIVAEKINAAKHAEYNRRWAQLTAERPALTDAECHELASELYKSIVETEIREMKYVKYWSNRERWARICFNMMPKKHSTHVSFIPTQDMQLRRDLRRLLSKKELNPEPESYQRLLISAADASIRAASDLAHVFNAGYDGRGGRPSLPNAHLFSVKDPLRQPSLRFDRLFEQFADEAGYPERTRNSWKSRVASFMAYSGLDYPIDATRRHAVLFKRYLIKDQNRDVGTTVRSGYFSALRSFFDWCRENNLGPEIDPFAKIKFYENRGKKRERPKKGFQDEEAALILAMALVPMAPSTASKVAAGQRWMPWLCASTGARISEVAQLRKQDIDLSDWSRRFRERVPIIRFSLDAGPLKGAEREIPVHPDLIRLGFLEFVAASSGERLFIDPSCRRSRSDVTGLTASAGRRIACWVQSLLPEDREVQPNHAWRHRFNDLCDAAKIHPEVRDYITGHTPATVGATYGNKQPVVLRDWMRTMDSHLDLVEELYPEIAAAVMRPSASRR